MSDGSITENTRAAYPLDFVPNRCVAGMAGIPKHVVMLTCDAFGVLPPISKLSPAQAAFWFLTGYTVRRCLALPRAAPASPSSSAPILPNSGAPGTPQAKVAGTEQGVTEPSATFSACFGLPFMPLNPTVYSTLLRDKLEKHNVSTWLLNTGWTGGPYGVGKRFSIKLTRTVLNAALDGQLDAVPFAHNDIFNVEVPLECAGVPSDLLNPRNTWADKAACTFNAGGVRREEAGAEQHLTACRASACVCMRARACVVDDLQANKLAAACCKAFVPFESHASQDVLDARPRPQLP